MATQVLQNKKGCCVKKCEVSGSNLYKFPRNFKLKNKWENILKVGIQNDLLVCSKHFQRHNFIEPKQNILKKNAVPDKNLPEGKIITTKTSPKSKQFTTNCEIKIKNLKTKNERSPISPKRSPKNSKNKKTLKNIKLDDSLNIEMDDRSSSPDFYGFPTENLIGNAEDYDGYHMIDMESETEVFYPPVCGDDLEHLHSDKEEKIQERAAVQKTERYIQKYEFSDGILYKFPCNPELKNEWKIISEINTVDKKRDILTHSDNFQNQNSFESIEKHILKESKKNVPEILDIKTPKKNDESNYKEKSNLVEIGNKYPTSPDFFGFVSSSNLNYKFNIEENNIIKLENAEGQTRIIHSPETVYNDDSVHDLKYVILNEEENLLAMQDIGVQTDYEVINPTKYFYKVLKTPNELECWTGIKNFDILKKLVKKIIEFEKKNNGLSSLKTEYMNLIPFEEYITIIMVRLKTNLNFLRMSSLFNMTEVEILNRFKIFLPILRSVLYKNNWPSKRLGKSFCLILEPFEFFLESNSIEESSTVKAMVGFDEFGTIMWSSDVYSHKISYNDICKTEEIYDKLRRIDTVIVDKDIGVHNEFKKRGLFCYMNAKPLNENIRYIKEKIKKQINLFEIFQNPISESMLCHLNDILSIACSTINLK